MERFQQLQAAIAKLEEDAVKCKKRFCQEEEEWKTCLRRNRLKYHPDKGGDEETFKDLGICDDTENDIMELRAMEDEAREMAEREAAEADVAELTWLEETDTQTDDIGTASDYSDSDGEYPHESTATSPSRRIGRGRVETSPKPRLQNSISPNMTNILSTMQYRADRSASRRRRVETKEDTTREMIRREVIRLKNEVIRLNKERAAARERERRRALDERESRAEVSQNCCTLWTNTFK